MKYCFEVRYNGAYADEIEVEAVSEDEAYDMAIQEIIDKVTFNPIEYIEGGGEPL